MCAINITKENISRGIKVQKISRTIERWMPKNSIVRINNESMPNIQRSQSKLRQQSLVIKPSINNSKMLSFSDYKINVIKL